MQTQKPVSTPDQRLNLWIFTDNKPGHRNQLQGLVNALSERCVIDGKWIPVLAQQRGFLGTLNKLRRQYKKRAPDLILGAGHSTHKFLLLSRWLFGGKAVLLMKPSLPISWFDLVLIPEHDGHFPQTNVIATRGVINKIKPMPAKNEGKGLFLIGGPSKHYAWDSRHVAGQVTAILTAHPDIDWQLTTSRRTPGDFIACLPGDSQNLSIIPHTACDADWLPKQLSESGQVWVSEDSVSMIYEALTSGALTGLLEVPATTSGRVQKGVLNLLQDKLLFRYSDWLLHPNLSLHPAQLNEADRCAELILKDFCNDE